MLLQDLRFAFRTLAKNRGVTAIAALSLALGIGANTAIFSLIDALLMRSLPVKDPQQLVLLTDPTAQGVSAGTSSGVREILSFDEYQHIRERQQVFDGLFAAESEVNSSDASVAGGEPEKLRTRLVTGSYFPVLGISAVAGRTFTPDDDKEEHNAPYAVISYAYWAKRFGRNADALGKAIKLGRASLTIVGVAPPGFSGETVGQPVDAWVPMMMEPDTKPGRQWLHDDESQVTRIMWLQVMGRLKPGITIQAAQANMDVAFRQILQSYNVPGLNDEQRRHQLDQRLQLHPGARGANSLSDQFTQPLYVLMAVVGLVLLIACANVANLLLARAAGRQKEIAVRLALGAGRLRLARQLLTEGLVLAAVGGVAGTLLAMWGVNILLRIASNSADGVPLDVHIDLRMLAFTAAISLVTGILFGLAPAIRAARLDVAPWLKDTARGVTSGSRFNAGKVLVVAQIAISLLLLIGAGLFVRTLRNLETLQLGYAREKLVLTGIDAATAGYKDAAAADLYNNVLDAVRSIPGVRIATYSVNGLFSGSESGTRLYVEGYTPPKPGQTGTRFDEVGPNYFSSVGIPILRGREPGRQDHIGTAGICVINQTMAHDFFDGRDPIGQHIRDLYPGSKGAWEIVGVVGDVRDHNLRGNIPRRFYVPIQGLFDVPPFINYEIRTYADPASVTAAIREKVRSINRVLPVNIQTLDVLVGRQTLTERIIAQLSAFFGALALLLACVGLYGVLSYAVTRRTNEIGIRMAIGAGQASVMWMILRETLVLVAAGTVIGAGGALGLARLVTSRIYGVKPTDPLTLIVSALVLTVVAIAAASIPARRAARVDPMIALRLE